jgi:hypothetical protein
MYGIRKGDIDGHVIKVLYIYMARPLITCRFEARGLSEREWKANRKY